MNTNSRSPLEPYASDSESSYCIGSFNSGTETDSDVPGPGRLLGKAYSFFGKKAENVLSVATVRVGRGPHATAMKIRRLNCESTPIGLSSQKLKKAGKRLVKYIRSNVVSTQDAALREVTELSFEDEQLRLLLKSDGLRAIGLLRQNRLVWHNMPKPIQSQAHRTLIALADENASIKDLVNSLRALPSQLWPPVELKLRACLFHPDYSFVIMRHFRRVVIEHPFFVYEVVQLLIHRLNSSTDTIEWPECDEILSQRLSTYFQRGINTGWGLGVLSRHFALLPKTVRSDSVQAVLDGLDSENTDIAIQSYANLPSPGELYIYDNLDSLSECSQSSITKLQERLASSPEQALSTICRSARSRYVQDADAVSRVCQLLAESIESEAESIQRQAVKNARVALCVNRYIRDEMVSALSQTSLGRMLVSETEVRCRPSDCPGRGRTNQRCKRHGDYHELEFRRHCDTHENLIHLDSPYTICEGECGATEEHALQYDENDILRIEILRNWPFAMGDHYPLVAGRLPDGRKSYVYDLHGEDGLQYVGSGPTPEETSFVRRGLDGKLIFISPSPSERLYVWVLRYNPGAYMYCEYYVKKMRVGIVRMDSTGPFSWEFERYLPTFNWAHTTEAYFCRDSDGDRTLSNIAEEVEVSDCSYQEDCKSLEDEDWQTAEEGSVNFRDVPHQS